jgi:hypothetical protein
MKKATIIPFCLLAAFWAAPARGDCFDLDAQETKVAAAKNCAEAHKLYSECLWGSSADIQRGAIVREMCEKGFLPALGAAESKSYRRRQEICERKYRNESGTMYRSMEAVCAAGAAYDFWRKYGTK